MRSRGLTAIEVLVILAILGIVLALLLPAIIAIGEGMGPSSDYYKRRETFVAKVVNAREVFLETKNKNVIRVDISRATVQPSVLPTDSRDLVMSPTIEVLDNLNDTSISKYDAETIQVNLIKDGWYQIETVGYRDEKGRFYPNIIHLNRIPDPPPVAEIGGLQ